MFEGVPFLVFPRCYTGVTPGRTFCNGYPVVGCYVLIFERRTGKELGGVLGLISEISIRVEEADALVFPADVLALKYAQSFYGVDAAVAKRFIAKGVDPSSIVPKPWGFRYLPTEGIIHTSNAMFVGVEPLRQFEYKGIRKFGRKVLTALAGAAPDTKHLALTLHGPGYGLDEQEAFRSLLAGILDAIGSLDIPRNLQIISILERNPGRAFRLNKLLDDLVPAGLIPLNAQGGLSEFGEERVKIFREAGYKSATKPHVFVAMPFAEDMEDVYHYGIQNAINKAGYLCERADLTAFTGDVLEWIKDRIKNAELVVADLSNANSNVYLEVGFAWGRGKPTVLLVRDSNHLKFDVQGQRCLVYKNIKGLEEALKKELQDLLSERGA